VFPVSGEVVLVGTDFSAVSVHALDEGRRLAARLGLPLELLHVREGFRREGSWSPGSHEASWLTEVGLSPEEVVVRTGTPWLELVRYAQERPANVVVVGTHGCTGFQPLSLGGTSARLAILSPCPVVLIGPKSRNGATVIG